MTDQNQQPPGRIGAWQRQDAVKRIDKNTIFDYMDGAGELYLGYRFDHLDAYEYNTADPLDTILAETYYMQSAADAFGLLSLDWGGEPVTLPGLDSPATEQGAAPPPRALYGAGLLRVWANNLYIRVMANRESKESRDAVLQIGAALAACAQPPMTPPQPKLLDFLPKTVAAQWQIQRSSIAYLRSYLVLNSLFYLSSHNILALDQTVEAAFARYNLSGNAAKAHALLIHYASVDLAQQALGHFLDIYVPEHKMAANKTLAAAALYKIEDGYLGLQQFGAYLAIIFHAPNAAIAQDAVTQISKQLSTGGSHGS